MKQCMLSLYSSTSLQVKSTAHISSSIQYLFHKYFSLLMLASKIASFIRFFFSDD